MKWLRVAVVSLVAAFCLMPASVSAVDIFKQPCEAAGAKSSSVCAANQSDSLTGPNGTLTKATRLIAYLTGIVAVIMLIVGGLMYVLSDGDSSKINTAKTTVIFAVVGIVIVVAAQAIIIFVINRL